MTVRHPTRVFAATLLVAVVMAACKKPALPPPPGPPPASQKPEAVNLTLTAAADVNPDANGRPSPVVVRIYQLKTDASFKAAAFFDLYDDEKKTLGDDLIDKGVEVTLRPGESKVVPNFFVLPFARFVGVMGAYRDRNADWKLVVPRPVPKNLTVSVGKLRLELAAK